MFGIGLLGGALSSVVSKGVQGVVEYQKAKIEHQQKIEIINMQAENNLQTEKEKSSQSDNNYEIQHLKTIIELEKATNIKWLECVRGLVRPITAYLSLFLLCYITFNSISEKNEVPMITITTIEFVISYYFAGRTCEKRR